MTLLRYIFIVIAVIPVLIYGENYQYQIKSININTTSNVSIKKSQNQYHLYETQLFQHHWTCDLDFSTQLWTYNNQKEQSKFIAKRTKDELKIKGIYRGKEIDITYAIDELPWYQFIDVYIPKTLQTKEPHQFWYLRSRDLKPVKLTFKFKHIDTIQVKNRDYTADLYQLSVSKWPTFLWGIDYWIDSQKKHLLKKKVNSNPTIEMIYIKQQTQ